jgi:hypothetical protein
LRYGTSLCDLLRKISIDAKLLMRKQSGAVFTETFNAQKQTNPSFIPSISGRTAAVSELRMHPSTGALL